MIDHICKAYCKGVVLHKKTAIYGAQNNGYFWTMGEEGCTSIPHLPTFALRSTLSIA